MIPIVAAAGGLLSQVLPLVDELFTTEEEKSKAKLKLLQLDQDGKLAQLTVNKEEAKHSSIFVAGWRPAVGWICAASLGYVAIVDPLIHTIGYYSGFDMSNVPEINTTITMQVLLGMLGLAGARTYEKQKGVNS